MSLFTFEAVLCPCSHSGLVDKWCRLLLDLKQDYYGIEPNIVHYNCTMDLLGRAVQLEEAQLFLDGMSHHAQDSDIQSLH